MKSPSNKQSVLQGPDEDGDFWFPFSNSQYEVSTKNEFDLSYLNQVNHSKIIIKDGHFFNEETKERVRFFGTNVCFSDAFPSKEDSQLLSKRMSQLGINLVRFHHMDHRDIFLDNSNSILNPSKIDLLHYFLFCLHKNGIYANINLHVSREYPEEEFTNELKSFFHFGKCLDRFYPPFIRDQIQYALNLLNSYNKYLKCKFGEDPMILNLELNNENTMFQLINDNLCFDMLKGTVFEKELEKQWNKWLMNVYGNKIENVEKEWNKNIIPIDRNNDLLKKLKFGHQQDKNTKFIINSKSESPVFDISINQKPKFFWSNQIHFYQFPIEPNTSYTIEFEAKAIPKINEENNLFVSVSFQESYEPYKCYAIQTQEVKLTKYFQIFSVILNSNETTETKDKQSSIICKLILSPLLGDYSFKNIRAYKGKDVFKISNLNESNKNKNKNKNKNEVQPKETNNLLKTLQFGHQQDINTKFVINSKGETPTFDVSFDKTPQSSWSNQIQFYRFPIEPNTSYTIEFEAKATPKNNEEKELFVNATFQESREPYHTYSVDNPKIKLTNDFQKYSFALKSTRSIETRDRESSIVFKLILSPHLGDYSFKNIIACTEEDPFYLQPLKEKYENYEIPIPISSKFPREAHRDFRLFIQETEINTQVTITKSIRSCFPASNILIVDSQASYGSSLSYEREYIYSDFLDNHQYWQHPIFDKGFPWDRSHYSIQNTPMFSECESFGTFKSLKMLKPFGKPYTISEYNHPFPNEHIHEKFPMFGSWAAFHDWDAIYQFSFDEGWKGLNFINGYFSMATNPIDFALAPFAALSFRKHYVSTSNNFVHVKVPKSYIRKMNEKGNISINSLLSTFFHAGWNSTFDVSIIETQDYQEPKFESNIDINEKCQFVSEEIVWKENSYQVSTEKMISITGFIGNSKKSIKNDLGFLNISLKLNEKLKESATVAIVSLDDQNLMKSKRILFVVAGKVKNSNQRWNKDRKSTGRTDEGANWGSGPSLVQFIEFDAVFNFSEKNKPYVWTINHLGEKKEKLEMEEVEKGKWKFSSEKSKPSLSFLIERIF